MANSAPTTRTELQTLVEDMRVAQFHLSNLLRIAVKDAEDEVESVIAAAIKYCAEEYDLWEKLNGIAEDQAKKGGA